MKAFRNTRHDWNLQAFISIIKSCFPLFLGTFLWSYILSASRIAVDANMASSFSSYFQALFMPVSIINLCATFILKPALTKLSQEYEKLSTDLAFIKSILVITGVIGVFTVICMAGAYLLGIPVLEIMTGTSLIKYKGVLVFLMTGRWNKFIIIFWVLYTHYNEKDGMDIQWLYYGCNSCEAGFRLFVK